MDQPKTLPSALVKLTALTETLKTRRPALFLDYDGTLTPIVAEPQLATLDGATRVVVARLATLCPVAVVSGRDLDDVRRLVGLDELIYAGSHGFDIAGPNGLRFQAPAGLAALPALDAAEAALSDRLAALPGTLLERKRFSLAAHFRGAAATAEAGVRAAVATVAEQYPGLTVTAGKKVLDLRPGADWNKGRAVAWLLERQAGDDEVFPIYLGDDVTDEDGFGAVAGRGLGIIVGPDERPTAASQALADPDEVRRFLALLADSLAVDR